MNKSSPTHPSWRHRTATECRGHEDQAGIDLFDDEDEGQFTIYIRYQDGTRWPARTVNCQDREHAQEVLDAWALRGEVGDYRADKSLSPTKEVTP